MILINVSADTDQHAIYEKLDGRAVRRSCPRRALPHPLYFTHAALGPPAEQLRWQDPDLTREP
ncbi:hypothetical protein [Devosia salina]|uniref:Uncharacterized protein n=1 Tax=Devosia salina TaxID=2860336 RepID=A0ABX8WMG3_9HYPH|nr:hypothetical protein [Devosia salina]QYO79216.1 hypothetical protein K1X15_04125 [Devosia salina]